MEGEGNKPNQDQVDIHRAEAEGMGMGELAPRVKPADSLPAPMPEKEDQTPEQKEGKEAIVDKMVSPTVSRFFALHENSENAFNPDHTFPENEAQVIAEENIDKKPSSAEVAADSYESRKEETKGVTREIWKESMKEQIGKWHESSDAAPILETLDSLGIDKGTEDEDLDQQIDDFRKKYVPSKKDNPNESQDAYKERLSKGLEQFAEDMAEGCKDEDGKIDIEKFNKRLDASQELLAIFGTQKNIDMKIRHYATAYAIAKENTPQDVKDLAKTKIADRLQQPVEDPTERSILSDLNDQHKKLELSQKESQTESQEQPSTQHSEEQNERENNEFITKSRLKELQNGIQGFLTKEALTEEDLAELKPLLSEYLKGVKIVDQKQFHNTLSQAYSEEQIQEIIATIREAGGGNGYAIHLIRAENGKVTIDNPVNINTNLPKLMDHGTIEPLIKKIYDEHQKLAEPRSKETIEALTINRLNEVIDGLQKFNDKTQAENMTAEDITEASSLMKEYFTGVEFFNEVQYRDKLKQHFPEVQIDELIKQLKAENEGNDPELGYAIRTIKENEKFAEDYIGDNKNIPVLMKNEKLAEVMRNALQEKNSIQHEPSD